ncbi:MAG: 5-bromo-4-chloroindolyl phosphate hydrolysis family protein [Clostridia bacterium]|nr:5-bromo-4-chloroindolyl phosphate hydrolysis family protein [Clostridia bacterium]
MSKKDKNNEEGKFNRKSIGSFVISAVVLTSIFGLSPLGVVLIAAASYGVGKLVGVMSTPLDTTTHNREDVKKTVDPIPMSGDNEADPIIKQGQDLLRQIRAANDAIPDPRLSDQLDRLEDVCYQIFRTVSEKPNKAGQIRKFMNYYLPTTLKMLNSYTIMQDRGVSSGDLAEARQTLYRGMDMVINACQKQLDNLFKDTMLDVSTDIDVLEQMLRRDGLTDSAFDSAMDSARTAAAAQMANEEVPVLHTEDIDNSEDFLSYYQQKRRS